MECTMTDAKTTPEVRVPVVTLDTLKLDIADALAANDNDKLFGVLAAISKHKAEIAKAAVEAAVAEASALAGEREKLAAAIHKAVKAIPQLAQQLKAVKAFGFHFTIDNAHGDNSVYKAVALDVPGIPKHKVGHAGGGSGKSKAEYGMTLQEIFDKFATAENRVKLDKAEGNSAQWAVKNEVKKAAIAAGKLQPAK